MIKGSDSKLVLLAGPPRSGTTWLNREICGAKNSFGFLPECTLLTQQIELYSRTLHYCDKQRFSAYFANEQGLLDYYRDNVFRFLDRIVRINANPGADMLVLKDPELTLYLDDIKGLFPPYKLLVLIRDPRDVLASMKRVNARKQQEAWNVQNAATHVFSYYYRIDMYQPSAEQNTMMVRYEDLVEEGLESVYAFLQLPHTRNTESESRMRELGEKLDVADPFFSELYLQPTTQDRVGSYKKTLSDEEIEHIEMVYAGVLQRWRY